MIEAKRTYYVARASWPSCVQLLTRLLSSELSSLLDCTPSQAERTPSRSQLSKQTELQARHIVSNGSLPMNPGDKKNFLHHKCFRHLHQTNTVVFTIMSVVKQSKFHLSSKIIAKLSYLTMLFIPLLAYRPPEE